MIRTVQLKLNPTPEQGVALQVWLDRCRKLYNALLEQRILAYKQSKVWPSSKAVGRNLASRYGQQNQLPELKAEIPSFSIVNAAVLQDVCSRIDKTFKAFFQRNRTVKTGGFPRFKPASRFNSFTHPCGINCAVDLNNREFRLPSFGWIKFHQVGRDLPTGTLKTATVKKMADGWWLNLTIAVAAESARQALPVPMGRSIGLDLGLRALVTTSDGDVLGDLTPIKKAERRIRLVQKELSRKVKGSNRRWKCKARLAKQNLKLTRMKDLQLHTISRRLVDQNDVLCVEDLNIAGMLKKDRANPTGMSGSGRRGLRRNIGLASWGKLLYQLAYKAEDAGRTVISVNPRGTSQTCSGCGSVPSVRKTLRDRTHRCLDCGLVLDRDWNAARNIQGRGLSELERQNGKYSPVVDSGRSGMPLKGVRGLTVGNEK